MDGQRFDHLTKSLLSTGSRRRFGGSLVAALLAWRRAGTAAADEASGVAIAAAGGGDGNLGQQTTGRPRPDQELPEPPCRPASPAAVCGDRCNRTAADGCGGRVRCACRGDLVCGPGDRCCPPERVCLPSGVCCPDGLVCAPGGGVCCPPDRICTVGGVPNSCCPVGSNCLRGICF